MQYTFPSDFLWGSSTAAAQVETVFDHQWKNFESKDGYTFLRTTDHEKRRDEDLEYIKKFGSMYRCGVDWSRLQRKAFAPFEQDVVDEYVAFFKKLNAANMKIMFVLHHFSNPMWFENNGTWENADNIPVFTDYVRQCIQHFGEYTYNWNTFNEPNVYAVNGFVLGAFPPMKKNPVAAMTVLKNMGKAHDASYQMLKVHYPDKQVGISLNTVYFEGQNFLGRQAAKFADWWFIDKAASYFEQLDFWGLSYYAYIPLNPTPITEIDNPGELTKMGIPHDKMWGYKPEAFRDIIKRFFRRYKKPIIITENGICTDDNDKRISSMQDYLKICHELIDEGVDLQGYIHWSTWDNFEWNLGPTYRFGLVRVDMETMERTMTKAGEYYAELTANNGF